MIGGPRETKPLTEEYARIFAAVLVLGPCLAVHAAWQPAAGPLMTRWAADVTPDNVHAEYPRPQMVRNAWLNLNGLWDYAIRPKDEAQPQTFDGQILVPFPIESALSGVMKPVGPDNRLWYRRRFEIPDDRQWTAGRTHILLNFGAVDWDTTVWVNGKEVGAHQGGYDPFTFDITDALKDSGAQEIVLSVWDPTDAGTQPRGKQVRNPGSIWYTAVTGIWQTVWIEPTAPLYIKSLNMAPDVDAGVLRLNVEIGGHPTDPDNLAIVAQLPGQIPSRPRPGEKRTGIVQGAIGATLEIVLEDPNLWSPDSPSLYDLDVMLCEEAGRVETPGGVIVRWGSIDEVRTYFAMRKIEIKKDKAGINRLFLNNKPLFQYGPLDQGWWPDGLYTAPTDEALRHDIEVTKQLGMNMARKHVKVEPDRWYYWCDKLGLLVWQDMPSGDKYIGDDDPDIQRSPESAQQFETELAALIHSFRNHPSIIMWVPYNEGWGQWDTTRITKWIKELDPTRLVNNTSGWTDRGVGDVHDIHSYPGPAVPPLEETRAIVLGEFGGLGLPVKGHTWQDERNWGYRSFTSRDELTDAYLALIRNLRLLLADGLSAAVYTQTTDVEIEVNGLMTYDRAMIKMDADKVRAASEKLYLPPPVVATFVPTSREEGRPWRYTMAKPADGWEQPDFDDTAWQTGRGGFGTESTPGTVVRTKWDTPDLWIRRSFDLADVDFAELCLAIHHDEDAEVYINGRLAARLQGYTSSYARVPLDADARTSLKKGPNHLAAHCHQTQGGQYLDLGLVEIKEQSEK